MTRGEVKKYASSLLLLILITAGCDRSIVYIDFARMPSETWHAGNVAEFSPEIKDTSSLNNIFITLRSGADYPFQNIWLFISTTSPSGKTITDTLEYLLADATGKRYGRGFGNIRETDLNFRKNAFFSEKGRYSFRIRHGMRVENLKGIFDIGLRIEQANRKKNRNS